MNPLWNLTKTDWWFHHVNGCDAFPPAEGDFLELPAGGSFTVQLADNRASTDLDGASTSEWPDGETASPLRIIDKVSSIVQIVDRTTAPGPL